MGGAAGTGCSRTIRVYAGGYVLWTTAMKCVVVVCGTLEKLAQFEPVVCHFTMTNTVAGRSFLARSVRASLWED